MEKPRFSFARGSIGEKLHDAKEIMVQGHVRPYPLVYIEHCAKPGFKVFVKSGQK